MPVWQELSNLLIVAPEIVHIFYLYIPCYSCKRKNFTLEFKLLLAKSVQKHSCILKPDLDPIEEARADLEMWVKVMNEIHSFGYTNTLASVQAQWSKIISDNRLAKKSIGPMTYLDFLVNSSRTDPIVTKNAANSSSTVGSEDAESCDSDLTEKIYVIQPESTKSDSKDNVVNNNDKNEITLESLLKRPIQAIAVPDNSDVICIDDDSDTDEMPRKVLNKNVDSAVSGAAVSNNCDINRKENNDIGNTTKTLNGLHNVRIKRWV